MCHRRRRTKVARYKGKREGQAPPLQGFSGPPEGGRYGMGDWMRKYFGWLMAMGLLACANVAAGADSPLLLQQPTISKSEVVFVYGGYLWSAPREGGEARQLTTGGHETHPGTKRIPHFRRTENGLHSRGSMTGTPTCT